MWQQQHNTHIANNSGQEITAVLTDNDNRNTTQVIAAGSYVCIPTSHGKVTVSVFRKICGKYGGDAEAQYTDDSDRSFIVKLVNNRLNIVRSKYGKIWVEETGLR